MSKLLGGVVGGFALLTGACFEGPDWPQSVPIGTNIESSGGNPTGEGGAGDAGLDGSFEGGASGFACSTPVANNCIIYSGVPSDIQASLESDCTVSSGQLLDGCPTLQLAGCCTSTASGYSVETCQYSPVLTSTIETGCSAGGGTFSATQ